MKFDSHAVAKDIYEAQQMWLKHFEPTSSYNITWRELPHNVRFTFVRAVEEILSAKFGDSQEYQELVAKCEEQEDELTDAKVEIDDITNEISILEDDRDYFQDKSNEAENALRKIQAIVSSDDTLGAQIEGILEDYNFVS